MTDEALSKDAVKEYYGSVLQSSDDLKTNACCCAAESIPASVKEALKEINDDVTNRFYGCGSPLPPLLEGCTVLDLGCGTGRDVYVASKLAGPNGRVIGVDMTDEQLDVANRNIDSQMERFGFDKPNVAFHKGYMEDLAAIGIEDNSVDVVMSNCVINLSPDKPSVFKEIFRVLKPGGELIFSDVFSGSRIAKDLQADPVLHGECLSGAMYYEDFRRMLQDLGIHDYRTVSSSVLEIGSDEIEKKIGMIDFFSDTIRAFAIPSLEDRRENYGQQAVYNGGIPDNETAFVFDQPFTFTKDESVAIDGNTADLLKGSRYSPYFSVTERSVHSGLFDQPKVTPSSSGGCC